MGAYEAQDFQRLTQRGCVETEAPRIVGARIEAEIAFVAVGADGFGGAAGAGVVA